MTIFLLILAIFILASAMAFRLSRRKSIIPSIAKKHFQVLADKFDLAVGGDDYYFHLEGVYRERQIVIAPYNLQGPGSVTLVYMDTGIPVRPRTWIEPNISLARAVVEKQPYSFDISGHFLQLEVLLPVMHTYRERFSYVAITIPGHYAFSPFVMHAIQPWNTLIVFIALDAGRKVPVEVLRQALDATVFLAEMVRRPEPEQVSSH